MRTTEIIESVNAWADYVESLPRKGQDVRHTFSPRHEPVLYALRKNCGAAITEIDTWTEVGRTDGQHITLQAPDGALVAYDASGTCERLTLL